MLRPDNQEFLPFSNLQASVAKSSPKLSEILQFYQTKSPKKIPAIKATAGDSSEDSDSDSESDAAPKKPATAPALTNGKAVKKAASSTSEDSDSEEEKKPAAKATPAKAVGKKAKSSSEDSSSEEEAPKKLLQ